MILIDFAGFAYSGGVEKKIVRIFECTTEVVYGHASLNELTDALNYANFPFKKT